MKAHTMNEHRLIDANEMLANESEAYMYAQRRVKDEGTRLVNMAVHTKIQMLIADTPVVDAVKVVHGRWIEKVDMVESYLSDCQEVFYECSVCDAANIGESPYCPNCGAKMDRGGGNGND